MLWGKEKVAKILSRLGTSDAKKILESIAAQDASLADEIRELMFTFEDLPDLGESDMRRLHAKVDPNDLLLALKGSSREMQTKLLSGISAKKRQMINEELELMGRVKRSDVEAARRRLLDVVRKMIDNGELSLDDEWIE